MGNILTYVFGIASVLGAILAIVFYTRPRRLRDISWAIRTTNLITNNVAVIPELEITYEGHSVSNLSVSKLLLWNRGAETIKKDDIAVADPLRIEAKGEVRMLKGTKITSNNEACQCQVIEEGNPKWLRIEFAFLDKQQGMVLQIIHTGKTSEDILLKGQVLGIGAPRRRTFYHIDNIARLFPRRAPRLPAERIRRRASLIVAVLSFFMPGLLVFSAWVNPGPSFTNTTLELQLTRAFTVGSAVLMLMIGLWLTYRIAVSGIPRGLEVFDETIESDR